MAALGPLLAALGRSWDDLGTTCKNHQKIDTKNDRFWLPKGVPNGTQIDPKTIPKRTKIDDKNRCEKNTSSRPSWSRLGRILSRFVTDPGVSFIDFSLVFKAFREHRRFSKNITSRAVLDRSKPDFGPTWRPKWLPNGSQNGSKTIKKSC